MPAKKAEEEKDLSAFVGVDPTYANYADVGQKPFFSEDEDVRKLEENALESEKNRVVEYNSYGMPVPKEEKKDEAKKARAPRAAKAADKKDDEKDEAPKVTAPVVEKKDEA